MLCQPAGEEAHGPRVGRLGLFPEALVCCTRSASSAPLWRSPRAPANRSSATWAPRTSAFLATFVSKALGASRGSKAPEHSQCPMQVGGESLLQSHDLTPGVSVPMTSPQPPRCGPMTLFQLKRLLGKWIVQAPLEILARDSFPYPPPSADYSVSVFPSPLSSFHPSTHPPSVCPVFQKYSQV